MHAPCASKYVMQQEMVIIIPGDSDELRKIIWSAINLPLRLQMVQVAFWRHYEEKWSLAELARRTNITAPLLLSHHSKLKIYCVVFSCVTLLLVYTYVHFLLPLHNAAYSFNSPNFFHFDKLFFRNSKALSLFVFCWLVISLSSKNWIKCKEYLISRKCTTFIQIYLLVRFQQKVWEVLVISVTLKVWSNFKLAFLPNESQPNKK